MTISSDSSRDDAEAGYLLTDVFEGDFGDGMSNHSARMVTTRKAHPCHVGFAFGTPDHMIPIGARARVDAWIEDGHGWMTTYHCVPCLAAWDIGTDDDLELDDEEGSQP